MKVLSEKLTKNLGIADLRGNIHGETTPSVSKIEILGELTNDFALFVQPEDETIDGFWIVPELLEFIDHAPGFEMTVGNIRAVRQADGSWAETRIKNKKTWWKFW
ncbi:hypothetical protein P0Y35_06555 [Kiritimatiellaeota bacterium B1221]|nr:hypothetical protein [Kiritimatiellaeota bacterium B1221]